MKQLIIPEFCSQQKITILIYSGLEPQILNEITYMYKQTSKQTTTTYHFLQEHPGEAYGKYLQYLAFSNNCFLRKKNHRKSHTPRKLRCRYIDIFRN